MKSVTKIIIAATTVALAGAAGYFSHITRTKNGSKACLTQYPETRDMVQYVTASGTLRVTDQISVGSLVTGRVIDVLVDDNDAVKKEQLLAIIDNGIGESAVKRTGALLEAALHEAAYQKAFFTRQRQLHTSKQLSDNEFEQISQQYAVAQARVKQLQAELELEKKTYQNLFITAPEGGIIIAKRIDLGQMVASQFNATVLFEIGKNLHEMEASIDVDEADIGNVKEGQRCFFSVDAFPREKFEARVKRVEYQAKIVENVVTYATILAIDNPELKLRPGMTTNVDIQIAQADDALAIPNKALRISQKSLTQAAQKDGYRLVPLAHIPRAPGPKQSKLIDDVWVLRGDTIEQRAVQLGVNDGKYSQVLKGLSPQDAVIVDIEESSNGNEIISKMFKQPGGIGR